METATDEPTSDATQQELSGSKTGHLTVACDSGASSQSLTIPAVWFLAHCGEGGGGAWWVLLKIPRGNTNGVEDEVTVTSG